MTLRSELRRLRRSAGGGRCRVCGRSGPRPSDADAWLGPDEGDDPDRADWVAVLAPLLARARNGGCPALFCDGCGRVSEVLYVQFFRHATEAELDLMADLGARRILRDPDADPEDREWAEQRLTGGHELEATPPRPDQPIGVADGKFGWDERT